MGEVGLLRQLVPVLTLAAAVSGGNVLLVGCRATESDLHRWAETLSGPRKLAAVVSHEKYPLDLRVAAGLTLATMRPRGGRHVGLQGGDDRDEVGLLRALERVHQEQRAILIGGMLPDLVQGMHQSANASGDPSIPYKDAAMGLLIHDGGRLVTEPAVQAQLRDALEAWVLADFEARLDNPSQAYGMEQVLRTLGADGVRRLPAGIVPDAQKLAKTVDLIAELGDERTKTVAGERLVHVARLTNTDSWLKAREDAVRKANEESKLKPTRQQFEAQLRQYQEEELLRLFGSMKRLGSEPVVAYLLEVAGRDELPEKRRAAALAALEGQLTEGKPERVQVLLGLARTPKTPDLVRGLALQRLGEAPREAIIEDLYRLFSAANWKVRWVAAELALKKSRAAQLGEVMQQLGKIRDMAITEPIRYGALIGRMDSPPSPARLAEKFARPEFPIPVRLAALGYFHAHGGLEDLASIQRYAEDLGRVPSCRPNAEGCEWRCVVGTGEEQRVQEVTTVGQFVSFCVVPELERRARAPKTP